MQTVLTLLSRALGMWLGSRDAVRKAAERWTQRLSGWKLLIVAVLALALYVYTWRGAYLWTLALIRQIPLPALQYGLAGLVTLGWMTWPLIRQIWRILRARRTMEGTAKFYVLVVFRRRGHVVHAYQSMTEPDEALEQEAIAAAIASAQEAGEITAPGDYGVSVHACEVSTQEFRSALRRQKSLV